MNNRQPPRRGRGRNNNNSNRNNSNRGSGGVDRDNRIDNRARGNAAQMLDKYKKMAQDAQVNGDRVNAEYYHQFADHYFRVNADTIARREEQRLAREEQRGPREDRDNSADQESDDQRQNRHPRGRQQRDERPKSEDRPQMEDRPRTEETREKSEGAVEDKKPVRARRPRKVASKPENGPVNGDAPETDVLDASALPPAISLSSNDVEVAKKPARKKRVVKPKVAKPAPIETEESGESDAA